MAVDAGVVFTRNDTEALSESVARIVGESPIVDMHTHLYAPAFGELLLWGVDELLTYHYLIAETMRVSDIGYSAFWGMTKEAQANHIWEELFLKRSPLSESCRGVLTALDQLGVDVANRDLVTIREYFKDQRPETFVDTVFEKAKLKSVVMTNDPFDDIERPVWEAALGFDERFLAALRIDPLLNDWENSHDRLKKFGYDVEVMLTAETCKEVRRFLTDWITRMNAKYMAVSLPPDFAYPEESPRAVLLRECVLPAAREANIPFALMVGVTRQVNPQLKLAGDGVAKADVQALLNLCAEFPDNKFMTTYLARENQHELCVAARKFPNLLLFGCWWFLNNPVLIEEMTRMRLELLGTSCVPQHSDARVLDQVLYKWAHSRQIIMKVLED